MADGIVVPEHVKEYTRSGVYLQLESRVLMIKEFEGTTDEAIDHYGLRGYIENDIAVLSSERAYTTFITNILNEETFKGAYAHLKKE